MSAGGRPRTPGEERPAAQLVDHGLRLRGIEGRHADGHVAHDLHEDAAEPAHDRRPEQGIALHPQDHLDAARRPCAAPARPRGAPPARGGAPRRASRRPRGGPAAASAQPTWTPPTSVLCAMSGESILMHHGIAQTLRGAHGLVGVPRGQGVGHGNPELAEQAHGLGVPEHAARSRVPQRVGAHHARPGASEGSAAGPSAACASGDAGWRGFSPRRSRKRRCSRAWRRASRAVSVPSRNGTPTSASGPTTSGSRSPPANELKREDELVRAPAGAPRG